jgi:hypothetical protein
MLEILGTIFGSIFSGGATGIIGVIAQRFADYKNKQLDMELEKQRFDNAVALKKVDAEIMAQEWAARTQVAQVEADAAKDVAASNAFAASYSMEPKQYSNSAKMTPKQQWVMVVLDAFRGGVRPLLTIYLCFLTTLVWMQARAVLGAGQLDTAAAMDVWKMVVGNILYLTTTCVLWWFGTRNKAKQPD